MKVYLVICSSGEYEDYSSWVEKVFAKMNVFEYLNNFVGIKDTYFPMEAPDFEKLLFELLRTLMFITQIIPYGFIISIILASKKIKIAKKSVEDFKRIKLNKDKNENN